jgi:hypothetical protein
MTWCCIQGPSCACLPGGPDVRVSACGAARRFALCKKCLTKAVEKNQQEVKEMEEEEKGEEVPDGRWHGRLMFKLFTSHGDSLADDATSDAAGATDAPPKTDPVDDIILGPGRGDACVP